ncbi:hypothetical protein TNCT_286431 [Trichonephila clavata]|uniref:Uncharacterized protein n=1 Tax=Trichonephila clavata TaxID=2740835 RepID=A0A8X6LQC8_TRICU|nr:hypothetical protein TNCT_286431 [Trichonephila clavata]
MIWLEIVVHLHYVISICCGVRNYNRSEEVIPITAASQSSNSNDVEIGVLSNEVASIDHHFPNPYSDTSEQEHRIFLCDTLLPDEYISTYYQDEQKNGEKNSSEKRMLQHYFIHQFTCTNAYFLWSRRYLAVNITHNIDQRA